MQGKNLYYQEQKKRKKTKNSKLKQSVMQKSNEKVRKDMEKLSKVQFLTIQYYKVTFLFHGKCQIQHHFLF